MMTTSIPVNLLNKPATAYKELSPKSRLRNYIGLFVYTFWPIPVAAVFELSGGAKGGFIDLSGIFYLLAFVLYTGPAILVSIITLFVSRFRSLKATKSIFIKLNVLFVSVLVTLCVIAANTSDNILLWFNVAVLCVGLVAIYFILRKPKVSDQQEDAKTA